MLKNLIKGIQISFGFILGIGLLFGIVYAVGFHSAEEILGGTFTGNFQFNDNVSFNNKVNFTNANVIGISGTIPSGAELKYSLASCPTGWSLTSQNEEADATGSGTEIFNFNGRPEALPVNAFNNVIADGWKSEDPCTNGGSYIGYDFGAGNDKHIRTVILNQGEISQPTNLAFMLTSVKIQYSDDNSIWLDAGTFAVVETDNLNQKLSLPETGKHRYWRILANSACGSHWSVREIEMKESYILCEKD